MSKPKTKAELAAPRSSGHDLIETFAGKSKEFEKKRDELQKMSQALKTRKMELIGERDEWKTGISQAHDIIGRGHNGRIAVSRNGKEAIKVLIEQAQKHVDINDALIAETQTELTKVIEQVEKINSLLASLKNSSYLLELSSSLQNKSVKMKDAGIGIGVIEFESIERDVRLLEYTTKALLEITSEK